MASTSKPPGQIAPHRNTVFETVTFIAWNKTLGPVAVEIDVRHLAYVYEIWPYACAEGMRLLRQPHGPLKVNTICSYVVVMNHPQHEDANTTPHITFPDTTG